MDELIFHILHRKFPFYKHSDVSYSWRVKCAPKLEHACVLDTSNGLVHHFKPDDADKLSTLLLKTQKIISYRGKEMGLLVLQRHHDLPKKLKKGGTHTDLHDVFSKLNKGKNVSLEKAIYSNIGKTAYKTRKEFRYLNQEDLIACCESDILNIFKLYTIFTNNEQVLKKLPKKAEKKKKLSKPVDNSFIEHAKLTIELVPKTSWFTNVRSQVSKKDWDAIRKATYKNSNNKCEICSGVGIRHAVECHEIWEYNDTNQIQKLLGFIALCPSCHEVKHIGNANRLGRADIAKTHLKKVNNWTGEQISIYIVNVYDLWFERNNYNWKLDLTLLDKMSVKYAKTPNN